MGSPSKCSGFHYLLHLWSQCQHCVLHFVLLFFKKMYIYPIEFPLKNYLFWWFCALAASPAIFPWHFTLISLSLISTEKPLCWIRPKVLFCPTSNFMQWLVRWPQKAYKQDMEAKASPCCCPPIPCTLRVSASEPQGSIPSSWPIVIGEPTYICKCCRVTTELW